MANDDREISISVDHVYKNFNLPHQRKNSIKGVFTGLLKPKDKKFVETQHALQDITFDIKQGEFFGIVGRNGSGKSTLLKILAGIYQPTRGRTLVKGRLVPFIELGVGFNPELTGRENIYLNGALLGFNDKEIEAMYDEIVVFAELEKFMDQKLKNYSSGMQVRLAFSMAIRADADILLVDEVLAVGDADFQRKCFEYFKSLKKKKQTVVFVSHDMDAIREYCDRAILINGGKVVSSGDAEDVSKDYTKMFNPTQVAPEVGVSNQKWGAGTADIQRLKFSKRILKPEDEFLEIYVTAKLLKDFDQPVLAGFTIKDETGHSICGTNSKIINYKFPKSTNGQELSMTWRVPNIFTEGMFFFEPSIIDGSDLSVCQWWDNAASFRVINGESTPYVVSPKITLKVS